MSKITFKEFLDEEKRRDSKRPTKAAEVKPIPLKPQVKPIATAAAPRVPSEAELKLKEILKKDARSGGHYRTLADILGIYPT